MSGTEPGTAGAPHEFSWRLKLLGGLIVLLFFIVASESMLRLLGPDSYYKNQFFPLNRDIDFTEIYQKDHDLFWRFRPNHTIDSRRFSAIEYHINADGRRGPDRPKDTHPAYRILALGNSCTFGWGVPYNQIFTSVLERDLNRDSDSGAIEVINAGVPGYSSYQGKVYFEKDLLGLKPDMVLIMFGWNDQWPAGQAISDADQQMPGGLLLAIHNKLSPFKLYQFARKLVLSSTDKADSTRLDNTVGTRRVSTDQFFGNLSEIISTARRHQIEPVLIVPPVASLENYFGGGVSSFHALHKQYENTIRRIARLEDVPLVDLQPIFDGYTDLYDDARADPVHFNADGHAVAARSIARVIAPYLPLHREPVPPPADTTETPFAGSR